MARFNIHVCLSPTIITLGLTASRCELADKHCRVFSFSIQEAFSFFPPSFLSAQNYSPYRGFTSQNCICSLSLIQHESRTITIQYNLCVRAYECVCAHTSFSKGGDSNPSTFTFSLWPNLRPVLQQRGLLPASRQFNHTYSTTPFSFPFHTASIPLRLHNSLLRAVEPRLSVCSLLKWHNQWLG